jgi:monoamine oxidase
MSAKADVAIVGAGAAGVAAARRLIASGLSVQVLEASARVGGRAWTLEVAGMALDLGCGWLHSADRNAWTRIAEAAGFAIQRGRAAWGMQYGDLGFSRTEQAAAHAAYASFERRLETAPPASDRAADALEPEGQWNAYLQAMSGFINGAPLERISIADYLAYDEASTHCNWRLKAGYGALVAASLPPRIGLNLSSPVASIALDPRGVVLTTRGGEVRARAAILAVSTHVLAGGAIELPRELDPWRRAAECLPLGRNEKLYLEIVGSGPFEPETAALGDPRDARTGHYYIRPFGWPVIECFFGGSGARILEEEGPVAGFAHALDQLAGLFGAKARRSLRPLAASNWGRTTWIGGGYSHALPGCRAARNDLARPFESRIFFAGEATNSSDFSTAHGAHDSGVRAAEEAIAALTRRRAT